MLRMIHESLSPFLFVEGRPGNIQSEDGDKKHLGQMIGHFSKVSFVPLLNFQNCVPDFHIVW